MQTAPALIKLEQTFQEMLLAAKAENWALLASLEGSSRAQLLGLKKSNLPAASLKSTLQRLLECNQELTRRVTDRRNDIAFLLDAFDDPDPGAHG